MRLLFDQNLSFRLVQRLDDLFPGSSQVRLLGLAAAKDAEIWRFAKENEFGIVTLDADFGDMAGLYGPPPQVIWLRCGNRPTAVIEALIRRCAAQIATLGDDEATACLEIY